MKISLLVMSFLFGILIKAQAESPTDLELLATVICRWETRGLSEADRNDAIGTSGEVGACQIKPGTARQIGYRGKNVRLFLPGINRAWALEYLRFCKSRLRTQSVFRLAHCYNAGPRARRYIAREYAKQIASDYAAAKFKMDFTRKERRRIASARTPAKEG